MDYDGFKQRYLPHIKAKVDRARLLLSRHATRVDEAATMAKTRRTGRIFCPLLGTKEPQREGSQIFHCEYEATPGWGRGKGALEATTNRSS